MQTMDKKHQIITELDEQQEKDELIRTMEHLDSYKIPSPTARSTAELIAFLKPVLQEQSVVAKETAMVATKNDCYLPKVMQLVQPQVMLLGKWFIVLSILFIVAGLLITNAVDGNSVKFLANASPILGILTVFYEFRAKLSGVNELEATCPYSPAQLATARLIVVFSYDILLCLMVTPVVSYWQGQVLWQVVVSWFAPLLLMLGIALAASLRFGIAGGCLVAMTAWASQFALSKRISEYILLLTKQSAMSMELISLAVGTVLIIYSYKRWNCDTVFSDID